MGLSGVYCGSLLYFVPVFHLSADEELVTGVRGLYAPGSDCAVELGELESTPCGGWKVSLGLQYRHSPGELSTHHAARVQYVPGNT